MGKMGALSSNYKVNQDDLTDWMDFLPSNLMEKTSPNLGALSANI